MYAIKDIDSNRCFAITDEALGCLFKNTPLTDTETVKIHNTGSSSICTSEGIITAIVIYPKYGHSSKATLYLIQTYPETLSLNEAYDLLNESL
jgi:hypothetical protein